MYDSRVRVAATRSQSIGGAAIVAVSLVGACLVASPVLAADGLPLVFTLYHPYAISKALTEKAVQEDLKMSPQQVKAVNLALERVRKQHQLDFTKYAKVADADRKKLVDDQLDQTTRDMFYALPGALRPDQIQRLKQILHQENGSALLAHPDVRALMHISDEQHSQLKKIEADVRRNLVENVRSGKVSRSDASRYDQLNIKLIPPEVRDALSPEQRKILKDLMGVRLVR